MENRFENHDDELVEHETIENSFETPQHNKFLQRTKWQTTKKLTYTKHHRCWRYSEKSFLNYGNNYKYKRRRLRNSKLFVGDLLSNVNRIDNVNRIGNGDYVDEVLAHYKVSCERKYKRGYSRYSSEFFVVNKLKWIFRKYVQCVKMLNICSLNIMVMVAIVMLSIADITEAGVCWTTRESNGKCTQRYSNNMSEEECCKHPNFAYTEREMSDVELFFAAAIDDGAVCKSCLDSCEAAKCGAGKRCVYRKGRPKCVCAPVCRSSSKQKVGIINSHSKQNQPSLQTNSPPQLLPKEQRTVPSFFQFGGVMEFDNEDEMSSKNQNNKSNKSLSSINTANKNSDIRWRRDSQSLAVAAALKMNSNETEHSVSNKRRKNQRKSKKMSKRRKQSTMQILSTTPISFRSNGRHIDDVEEFGSDERQGDSPKSGRIIIMAGNSDAGFKKAMQQQQHKKLSNSSSTQYSAIHHNRHQNKKEQQRHQSRVNRTLNAGASKMKTDLQTSLLLGDKIRNGFYNHGFPNPGADDSLHAHGRYYNPVCGTDGKTYKTECQLKKRACRRESTTLAVAYRGHCQTSCKMVRCVNNLTCVEDQYGLPHCISCTITCPQDDATSVIDPARAVCGADGLTYKSICDINRLICTTGRSIAVAYYGVCQNEANCNTIQCRDKQICLNDLLSNKPRCISCSFKCPRKRRPQGQRYQEHKICGTNNLTYHSWCQMRRESCNTGFYIDIKHLGPCHKNSVSLKPKNT